MKSFAVTLSALSLVAGVLSQSAMIESPAKGDSVDRGCLVLDIVRPNTISSSEEVGIAIGIASCASKACLPANATMGTLLYNGDFDPELDDDPSSTGQTQPHQQITVEIPDDFPQGEAQINFAHFYLLGASLSPWMETSSVRVQVN